MDKIGIAREAAKRIAEGAFEQIRAHASMVAANRIEPLLNDHQAERLILDDVIDELQSLRTHDVAND